MYLEKNEFLLWTDNGGRLYEALLLSTKNTKNYRRLSWLHDWRILGRIAQTKIIIIDNAVHYHKWLSENVATNWIYSRQKWYWKK
jgi:hypothetical protein